jgi:hypothetical protein
MQLVNHPLVRKWLGQFEPADVDNSVALVNALEVVTSESQDADLRAIIQHYATPGRTVAMFAAREIDKSGPGPVDALLQ